MTERIWEKRLFLPLLCGFLFVFTLIIFAPIEVYFSNTENLRFALSDFWWINTLAAAIFVLVLTLLCTKLPKKPSACILSALFSLTFCMWLQGNYLNPKTGELSGEDIDWSLYYGRGVIELVIWCAVFLFTFFICFKKEELWQKTVAAVSVLLILMQLTALVYIFCTNAISREDLKMDFLKDRTLELSTDENIIIIVLDYFDNRFREELLKEQPDFFDGMDGFVCYTNSVASYPRTYPSALHILTTEECAYEVGKNVWTERAVTNGKGIGELSSMGYDVRITPSKEGIGISDSYKEEVLVADNWGELNLSYDYVRIETSLFDIVLFRNLPTLLKPYFEEKATNAGKDIFEDPVSNAYTGNDSVFYKTLTQSGLKASLSENAFRYYHLKGTHPPYSYDENMTVVSTKKTTVVRQAMGEFKIVFEYLDQLKKLGLYDSSLVIITADHGVVDHDGHLKEPRTPIMFVKEKGSGTGVKYRTSSAPVSHEDIWSTIRAEFIPGHENDLEFSDIAETSDRKRYFHATHVDESGVEKILLTYEISGDANDINNWKIVSENEILHPSYHDPYPDE